MPSSLAGVQGGHVEALFFQPVQNGEHELAGQSLATKVGLSIDVYEEGSTVLWILGACRPGENDHACTRHDVALPIFGQPALIVAVRQCSYQPWAGDLDCVVQFILCALVHFLKH